MTAKPSTFQSIFFDENSVKSVRVPDYQRAFAWDKKQADLFIGDLTKYKDRASDYYFGHYIVENTETGWDLVDGQQRITTFVLFLMICRCLLPSENSPAFSLIERFSTVSYDDENLKLIGGHLEGISELSFKIDWGRDNISDNEIIAAFSMESAKLTLSLKRIMWVLLRFHQAFEKGELDKSSIDAYIGVVMNANCSRHIAKDKSVAVNVFEMHNTRGIRLTTIEIVKAKLMQFVYDNGGSKEERMQNVEVIQANFGAIFRMEELLAASAFRGELSLEHLLVLHLRVIDDCSKTEAKEFSYPAANSDVDAIVKYLDGRLNCCDSEKNPEERRTIGVGYALKMASEFEKSVRIVSEELPIWDKVEELVGDVLILEKDLSCQFFLLACRQLETEKNSANGRLHNEDLELWEKLLFTRDFHEKYFNLKGPRDNFHGLFSDLLQGAAPIKDVIGGYLADGFRYNDHTVDLQGIVREFLEVSKPQILNNAFYWWKHKMKYVIYKYEKSVGADIRRVIKGKVSVEHILPQSWYWIKDSPEGGDLWGDEDTWELFREKIDACINGIGNLLLITPSENTSASNYHPKDKRYEQLCSGGSYEEHNKNCGQWQDPNKWRCIIEKRGEKIYNFMLNNLVGKSYKV